MYISSLHYNKEESRKVVLCIYHHFITTRKDKEKLRYVYIITSLQQGRIKRKVKLCMNHHFIITRKDKKKSCAMYISSIHYNKER